MLLNGRFPCLSHGALLMLLNCDMESLVFAKIQLAFALINEKVPEIQNHNFLELCFKTLSLQY